MPNPFFVHSAHEPHSPALQAKARNSPPVTQVWLPAFASELSLAQSVLCAVCMQDILELFNDISDSERSRALVIKVQASRAPPAAKVVDWQQWRHVWSGWVGLHRSWYYPLMSHHGGLEGRISTPGKPNVHIPLQGAIRRFLTLIAKQNSEVQRRVKQRQKGRATIVRNGHFNIEESTLDVLSELPNLTIESAAAAYNAVSSLRQPCNIRRLLHKCCGHFSVVGL